MGLSKVHWAVVGIFGSLTVTLGLALLIRSSVDTHSSHKNAYRNANKGTDEGTLPEDIMQEIWSHQDDVNRIIDFILNGNGKHVTYRMLANLTDTYGHRLTGTQELEEAIDYVLQKLQEDGFENVHGETFMGPKWERGEERAAITSPRYHGMSILGLGGSIGTNGSKLSADVIVVRSFDELDEKQDQVQGKIVVYNQPYIDYGQSVQYRSQGASRASKYGAVAALIRSVTSYSVYSPHTGTQTYTDDVTPIPAICITVEDAELMQRLQERGEKITVEIQSTTQNHDPVETRNLVGELRGSEIPEELVIIGGHIDSWDVGTGAMDDAGGVVVSWQVLKVLKALNLIPKRTVRVVGWSAEEQGLIGGREYFLKNKNETNITSFIAESDSGLWKPTGMGVGGTNYAIAIIQEILKMVSVLNATVVFPGFTGPDIGDWVNDGVPGGALAVEYDYYTIYHHTLGDTMSMMDPDNMDLCTAMWTVVTYVVANLQDKLPREDLPPPIGLATALAATNNFIVICLTTALSLVISYF